MNAKQLIQIAWVAEIAVLLGYVIIASYTLSVDRWTELLKALPTIGALIAGQGGAAAIGPEVKRWIEAWLAKTKASKED